MSFPDGMRIDTVDDLKRAFRACGSYFFEPDTMRLFRSRVAPGIRRLDDDRAAFITSERFQTSAGWCDARKFTVRVAKFTELTRSDGLTVWDVDTAEPHGFQHAASLRQARRLLQDLS